MREIKRENPMDFSEKYTQQFRTTTKLTDKNTDEMKNAQTENTLTVIDIVHSRFRPHNNIRHCHTYMMMRSLNGHEDIIIKKKIFSV